ncbi:hypothetical protein VST7929_01244 [Vibrio stylophorae]|uniref:Uncharacterized protein n=1 Tax=Vibrio stylophorae TaxID=659351 RepID=A0ABM8ZST0_9VIBR|nr:hypothetical protein VST7929_01244 [Vibrio stylophorae]
MNAALQPFVSDGCSLFPNGDWSQPNVWLHCCVAHDFAYWQGGTKAQRYAADQALEQCVMAQGFSWTAQAMFLGVRFGGNPYWPMWYRWGYGWPYPSSYQPLTTMQQQQVEAQVAILSAPLKQQLHLK